MYTIAGNLCKDNYKWSNTETLTGETDMIDDPMIDIEKKMDMKMAIDKLPEIYKEAILLHFFYGWKLTEIAAALNTKVHVVKYRRKEKSFCEK